MLFNRDFDPFLVGFETLFKDIENIHNPTPNFPPHDIVKVDDSDFEIRIALAGYTENDIQVNQENRKLIISANKQQDDEQKSESYLYKGIAKRTFKKEFYLSEDAEVQDCYLDNGILVIKIHEHVPEYKKPKTIEVRKLKSLK